MKSETALDEFDLRHYDAQIGRWITTDPYEQFANPYLGMGNNPVSNVDPDGGVSIRRFLTPPGIEGFTTGAFLNGVSSTMAGLSLANQFDGLLGGENRQFDWYKDMYGIMQFNPAVKNQRDLLLKGVIGGKYIGETNSAITGMGNKIEYRRDGSILFDNENDAYLRMKIIGLSREAFI